QRIAPLVERAAQRLRTAQITLLGGRELRRQPPLRTRRNGRCRRDPLRRYLARALACLQRHDRQERRARRDQQRRRGESPVVPSPAMRRTRRELGADRAPQLGRRRDLAWERGRQLVEPIVGSWMLAHKLSALINSWRARWSC